MKKIFFVLVIFLVSLMPLFAQDPPPPPDQGGGGTNGNPIGGGGAPIGSGLTILLLMGAGYGIKKIHDSKQEKE
jgi:hypothetical protein